MIHVYNHATKTYQMIGKRLTGEVLPGAFVRKRMVDPSFFQDMEKLDPAALLFKEEDESNN